MARSTERTGWRWGRGGPGVQGQAANSSWRWGSGLAAAAFIGSGGGAAVNPAERNGFVKGVANAVAVARRLDCKRLIITVGHEVPGLSRGEQHTNPALARSTTGIYFSGSTSWAMKAMWGWNTDLL